MKKFKHLVPILTLVIAVMASGCTLFGLKKQTDFNRVTNVDTIDAHLYKTAWAYLKGRAYGSKTDTIFRRLYDGIIYSGIDTNEYIQPNRTFIFLTNTSVATYVWAKYKNGTAVGKSWASYSKADVKNYLSYLILQGQYSHYNLPLTNVSAQTLAPAGVYTTNPTTFLAPVAAGATYNPNPNSKMLLRVSNANTVTSQLDYPIVLNDGNNVNTSDLLATNGVVSVLTNSAVPFFYPLQ